jgi:hypothetical protein
MWPAHACSQQHCKRAWIQLHMQMGSVRGSTTEAPLRPLPHFKNTAGNMWRVYVGAAANCPTDADVAQLGLVTGPRMGVAEHFFFAPPTEANARAFLNMWPQAQPHSEDHVHWHDDDPDPTTSWKVLPGYDPANPRPFPPATCRETRYWWSWCEAVDGGPHPRAPRLRPYLVFNNERDALTFVIGRQSAKQGWPFAENPHNHHVDGSRDGFEVMRTRAADGGAGAKTIQQFLVSQQASFARLRLFRSKVWGAVSTTPLTRFVSAVADTADRRSDIEAVSTSACRAASRVVDTRCCCCQIAAAAVAVFDATSPNRAYRNSMKGFGRR